MDSTMNVEGTVSIDFISSLETSKNLNNPLSSVLLESLPQMSIHPSPDFLVLPNSAEL